MTKLPEVTAKHIKDWWTRHGNDIELPDKVIEDIAARGNARAQRLEDEREAAKQKHSSNEIKGGTTNDSENKSKKSEEDSQT